MLQQPIVQAVLRRFTKAFIAGALSTITVISVSGVNSFSDLAMAVKVLALMGVVGGINGVILAGEKFINWQE